MPHNAVARTRELWIGEEITDAPRAVVGHSARANRSARFGLILPTVGNAYLRFAQLLVLVAVTHLSGGLFRSELISGFALLSAFAILTDSGAGNYLLATTADKIDRVIYDKVTALHFGIGAIGVACSISYTCGSNGFRIDQFELLLLASLGLSQVLDSLSRVVRAPLLIARRDARYALPDAWLATFKVLVLAVTIGSRHLGLLVALPFGSLVVVVFSRRTVCREFAYLRTRSINSISGKVTLPVLEYGATGALSAFYSQAPLIIGAAMLPVSELGAIAIAYRVVQALELVPSMLSSQLIPRVRGSGFSPWFYWRLFAGGGAVLTVAVVAASPIVERVFDTKFHPVYIFAIIAAAFVPKAGNYALVAYLVGSGWIRARLLVTTAVGMLAILVAITGVLCFGRIGLAIATPTAELLLLFGFGVAFRVMRQSTGRAAASQ